MNDHVGYADYIPVPGRQRELLEQLRQVLRRDVAEVSYHNVVAARWHE